MHRGNDTLIGIWVTKKSLSGEDVENNHSQQEKEQWPQYGTYLGTFKEQKGQQSWIKVS